MCLTSRTRAIGVLLLVPLAMAPIAARAQTTLPGVTVSTPSPVTPSKGATSPTPPSSADATSGKSPAKAKTAAPAPAVTPSAPPPALPLPGTLIVADDSFVPVTVILDGALAPNPSASLADLLSTTPGVAASTFAPGASRPIIRGLENNRVRIQDNGVASHDVSALSEDHGVPIDPLVGGRVEVIRGPATLRYGSQSIGGVVSAENNRIPTIIPPSGFSLETRGGWTSVNSGRDGGLIVDVGSGNVAIHADAFSRDAGDYRTPHGVQPNSSLHADGGSLGGSLIFDKGYFGVAYTRYASLYRIPGVEAAERALRIDLDQWRLTSKGEWRVESGAVDRIRFWFGRTEYRHDEISIDPGTGEREIGSTFRNTELEGRIEVQHRPLLMAFGRLTGAVGLQLGDRRLSAAGEGGELLAPNRTDTAALFIFEELQPTDRLRIQAAARMERARVRGTAALFPDTFLPPPDEPDLEGRNRTFKPRSVSLGILHELPLGIVARVTGQLVERAPDAAELFSKGPHEATQTFEIGNPNLAIERARTLEIGFRRARGDFRFDATAFHTEFDGFIFKRLTGVTCDDDFASCGAGSELEQLVFGQRDATFQGVEIAAQWDVIPIWRGVLGIDGQYDFVRARFEDGSAVPRIPPHRAGAGVYYKDGRWYARVGFLHAFRQDEIALGETSTSSYSLLNAELSYTIRPSATGPGAREIVIGLRGDNLLDDDVRNHVSFRKDEVLQPGRSIRLFGTLKFN
ncbi:MAG TPA: TonB-dependent receptor [Hyphomicrobiaceae bacterium]|nr:TonB-dependent receptor [Hyphomicrobiaceae bacterium]